MTTTETEPAIDRGRVVELVLDPPSDAAGAHRLVDDLVVAGLPHPRERRVRTDRDDIALSLTLHGHADLGAWAELVDTIGAVDTGPWAVGPTSWEVVVGRLAGLRTVLAAEVETPAGVTS